MNPTRSTASEQRLHCTRVTDYKRKTTSLNLNDPAFLHLRHPRQKNGMGSLRDCNEFNIWDDSWQRWFNMIRRSVNKFNIIRYVHRDYNHSHTPTDAHNLYKITNHPSTWTLLRVSAINRHSPRDSQQIISLFFSSPLETDRFWVTRISLSTIYGRFVSDRKTVQAWNTIICP
jgi:hypothetical protein